MVLPISEKAHELPPKRGKTPTEFFASFCPPIQYLPCNPYSLKECNKRSRLSDKTDDCFVSRPARVRQTQDPQLRRLLTYFDSRTREGCDPPHRGAARGRSGFNSRTREGCDCYAHRCGRVLLHVSIHAPARGATCHLLIFLMSPALQFTHPRGVRLRQ